MTPFDRRLAAAIFLTLACVYLPFRMLDASWSSATRIKVFALAILSFDVVHNFNNLYEDKFEVSCSQHLNFQRSMMMPAHAPLWLAPLAASSTFANGGSLISIAALPQSAASMITAHGFVMCEIYGSSCRS